MDCTISTSPVAAKTFVASERLPLGEDPCLIPACRYNLLIVCCSESQARYTSGPLSNWRCLNASSKACPLCAITSFEPGRNPRYSFMPESPQPRRERTLGHASSAARHREIHLSRPTAFGDVCAQLQLGLDGTAGIQHVANLQHGQLGDTNAGGVREP